MSLHRGFDASEPVRPDPIGRLAEAGEYRKSERTWRLATGTLACPSCDAPVSPGEQPVAPPDPLACPFCAHSGAVRDFLSLAAPARPAVVEVRIVQRVRLSRARR